MYKSFSTIESEHLLAEITLPQNPADEKDFLKQIQERILYKFITERNKRYDYQRHIHEGATIVAVNLSRAVARETDSFQKFLNFVIDEGAKQIVVDLTNTDFIDSAFAGVLVQFSKKVKEFGGEFCLVVDLSKVIYYQTTFNVMVKAFHIYEDYKTALNSFHSCKEKNRITAGRKSINIFYDINGKAI